MPLERIDYKTHTLKPSLNVWFDNNYGKDVKRKLATIGPEAIPGLANIKWCEQFYEYNLDEVEGCLFECAIKYNHPNIESLLLSMTKYSNMLEERDTRRALCVWMALVWNAMNNINTGDEVPFFTRETEKRKAEAYAEAERQSNMSDREHIEELQARIEELEEELEFAELDARCH
jgi:hypothetical protein